jgi:hypothetical protein
VATAEEEVEEVEEEVVEEEVEEEGSSGAQPNFSNERPTGGQKDASQMNRTTFQFFFCGTS